MLKSYPWNILNVQSESSKISNLGHVSAISLRIVPLIIHMNHFSYPKLMSKSIFLKNSKISFPNWNPRPQTIEPAPPVFLTIECPGKSWPLKYLMPRPAHPYLPLLGSRPPPARSIRLLTITLKRLYLAPPNLVTFSFYLLDTFWQNFSKIDSPGGCCSCFLKSDVSKNWTYEFFCFAWKTWQCRGGIICARKDAFRHKKWFFRVLLNSRG